MIKPLSNLLKQDKEKYTVPRKVQDVIPIRRMWSDGIFQVGSKFSKSYQFSDINYQVASLEDKKVMFLDYSELLNSLDSGATTKITINNRRLNRDNFEQSILMPLRGDSRDVYRREYNQMLLDKATGANGIMQEKYITITVAKKNIEDARTYFARVGADLTAHFAALGSKCVELTDMNRNLMLSIDVVPIPMDEAVREVENRLLGVETNITNWQRRQNANNNFSATIPYDMEQQRKESKEFLDDLTARDQRMTMAVLKFQQLDGLNTVLPIGSRKINAFRTLTTESLAVFMPFKVQEIQDKGGIYFGENAISQNLIMCNKANLLNQSAFLLGVPGSGKSFSAKELIAFLMLNTEDDILICDPEGEFAPLVEAMGSDIGTVISVAAGGKDRLNAMYMVEGYGENNPIVEKSQFIMSLVEQIDKHGVGPQHKSIIDRCTALVYQKAEETGIIPTLCTLREKLMEQPEEKTREIALSLELFTTDSLDIFGHGSNVDLDKRVVVFNIHDLGEQLKPTGLLVITDIMLNRVTLNWKRGKRTHVFKDRGQWADNSIEPTPGMIIFFDWDSPNGSSGPQDGQSDHVGIVEKCENGIVYTVEGNSGDSCRKRQYSVGYYEILGYGIPAY